MVACDAGAGGYHELLQGPEKQDAVRFLSDWILSHSGPQVRAGALCLHVTDALLFVRQHLAYI